MKINWKKVWVEWEKWWSKKTKTKTCTLCGHSGIDIPEWEDQQKKIQQIVDKQLKKSATKKQKSAKSSRKCSVKEIKK
jgi:hypothetical protein